MGGSEREDLVQSSAEVTPGGPHRILVVDDEPDLEQLVRQRMRREIRSGQYVMEFAHNGLEALDKLDRQDRFDIVL